MLCIVFAIRIAFIIIVEAVGQTNCASCVMPPNDCALAVDANDTIAVAAMSERVFMMNLSKLIN